MSRSIAKNAIYSGVRAISTTLFPLITYPYAARVLMAEGLGKVNFSASIMSYFTLIAGLGIVTYATREGAAVRNNKSQLEVFAGQVFTINLASTCISLILLVLLVAIWPKLEPYKALLAVQSVGIVAAALGVEWVFNVFEDYGYITARTIIVQFASAILMFLLVKGPKDFVIYSAIVTLSTAGANIFNFYHSKKYLKIRLTFRLDLKRHLKPILILFANALAMSVYVNIDATLIGVFCGDSQVGLYGLGGKVYTLSKTVFTAVVAVVIPRLSMYYRDNTGAYYELFYKSMRCTVLVLMPVIFGLLCLADYVVLIIGGEGYAATVPVLRVLALAMLPAVLSMCLTNMVLLPAGHEADCLKATAIGAVVNTALNMLWLPRFGMMASAYATLFAECAVAAICSYKAKAILPPKAGGKIECLLNAVMGGFVFVPMTMCLKPILGLTIPAFAMISILSSAVIITIYLSRGELKPSRKNKTSETENR